MQLFSFMLAASGVFYAASAQAQITEDELIAAYKKGKDDGWNECRVTLGRASPGTTGTVIGTLSSNAGGADFGSGFGGTAPSTKGFELPGAFIDQTEGAIPHKIPQDWLVTPSPTNGAGILGRVDNGEFKPYITDPSGRIMLETDDQLPRWTTDDNVRKFIQNLPKASDGTIFIPVEPAM
ncbi:hypothetical protein [Paracoccus sp. (in: a-proteobacteria)]|uniref:hypothetical protein n=1 Tax=Paracoccus sp. TaxID=267 RepID=UPI003A8691B3